MLKTNKKDTKNYYFDMGEYYKRIKKLQITMIETIKNEDDLNLKTLIVCGIFTCAVHAMFQNSVLSHLLKKKHVQNRAKNNQK